MASRLLDDPTADAQLRRDLLLTSNAHSTDYDVAAGLARFSAEHNQEPDSCETRLTAVGGRS